MRRRVLEGLGDVLVLRGAYPQAAGKLEAARSLAADDLARAQIDAKLGDLAFKRGDLRASARALERALRQLGGGCPGASSG